MRTTQEEHSKATIDIQQIVHCGVSDSVSRGKNVRLIESTKIGCEKSMPPTAKT